MPVGWAGKGLSLECGMTEDPEALKKMGAMEPESGGRTVSVVVKG
jgi:hypothetical protein